MQNREPGYVPEWTIHDRLRKAREFAQLEQEQLAALIPCTRQTVSNYETGKVRPQMIRVQRWADVCHVDVAWVIHGDGPSGGPGVPEYAPRDSNPQPTENDLYAWERELQAA